MIANRFERVEARLDRVDERLERVEGHLQRVDGRLERVEGRLDNIVDFMGAHHRDHEDRIRKLEATVFRPPG
jgi:exonuclease VII small subunit